MIKKISGFLVGLLLTTNVFAINTQEKEVLVKVQKQYPELKIEDVVYLSNVNLYQLYSKDSPSLTFTNNNLDYFYAGGELIDPKKKKSVSAERDIINSQRFFVGLPVDKAIVVKYGKGTRKLAIFTDPDCPFCKATDKEIHTRLNKEDITLYYYMNPLRIPGHEDAPLKAKKIWCDPNKSKAFVEWMLNDKLPNNAGTCKNPVDDTKALSDKVGFNSTPTLIFDNGYIVRSQLKAEDIMELFNKLPAAKNPR